MPGTATGDNGSEVRENVKRVTFVRAQIKESLALLHPHILSSFKLQPLSKSTPVNNQIVYSIVILKNKV